MGDSDETDFGRILTDDFYESIIDLILMINFMMPSFHILWNYGKFMDQFISSIIIIYNKGFAGR